MLIVFRTKGNHKQGMGDVMGSLALAECFSDKEIVFVIDNDPETRECIKKHGFQVKPVDFLSQELAYFESASPDIVIVNQLNNPKEFLQELKKRTKLLVTIDDVGPGAAVADMRFNPEYFLPNSYFGPEFVPLRKEFQDYNNKEKLVKKQIENILVTLGGSDTYGFTPKVVQALAGIPKEVDITVLVGSSFAHHDQLAEMIKDMPRPFFVRQNINNMAETIFKSDLIVCNGGITLFEAACLGTPAIVVCGEPFEEETAAHMQKEGFGVNLGFLKRHLPAERSSSARLSELIYQAVDNLGQNYEQRLAMNKIGKKLADGLGAQRIAKIILEKNL